MNLKRAISLLGAVLLGAIIVVLFVNVTKKNNAVTSNYSTVGVTRPSEKITTVPSQSSPSKISPNAVDASLAVLDALSNDYVASNVNQTATDNNQDIATQTTTLLLKQNQYLQDGDAYVEKYSKDPNKYISLTATGMIMGADEIIKANSDLIQYIKTADENDPNFQQNLSYAIAKHTTAQDQGFKDIVLFAPQISALYYNLPKSNHPTGPIPYIISSSDRQAIIDKINALFGQALEQYPKGYDSNNNNYVPVLVAVNAIQNNVVPDTYEEANSLK